MSWSAHAASWMLQAAATLPDTIVTKPIAAPQTWFDRLTGIASGLMSLALLALTVALVPAAWNFRKSYKKVSDLLDRLYGEISPLMRHAGTIADNVDYVTTAIRTDVQEVSRTIASTNRRLEEAMRIAERRLREFEALLAVAQREAEALVVGAAATVRGARAGIATLGEEMEDDFADEDVDEDEYGDGEYDDEYDDADAPFEDELAEDDGFEEEASNAERDDDEHEPPAARPRGPRVRRRG